MSLNHSLASMRCADGGLGTSIVAMMLAVMAVIPGDAGEPVGARDRVEVRAADGRVVTGTVVVEAVDGGVLLEHDDGRYEAFEPGTLSGKTVIEAPAPLVVEEFGQQVLATLPHGFELLQTKHYVICFNTTRDYAKWCAALFERLHDAFGNYWTKAGLELSAAHRPLVVVIFADRQAYAAAAAGDLGAAADRVVGYYNLLSNRVITYDLTGSDAVAAARGRRPGQVGLEILSSPAASGMVATVVHEATHQLAFNRGMHRRLAAVPLWVSEGIATYFETPDLENARGWRAIGAVNRARLDQFLATFRPGAIESIIADDEPFRRADSALDAYAAAWALTHYLLQTRKEEFIAYQKMLGAKAPLAEDSAEARRREFQKAFGDPRDVEQAVFKASARLASRSR
jgi:hypothetical protein